LPGRGNSNGARTGITNLPDPIPHPDHVIIDIRNGTARIVGPMTREEKAEYDYFRSEKLKLQESVDALRAELEHETDPDERLDIEKHLDIGERVLANLRKAVPD
jgi:hypothetical protein